MTLFPTPVKNKGITMPGAFAHITLVNELKEPLRLEGISGFNPDAITAVLDFFKFCELASSARTILILQWVTAMLPSGQT